VWIADEMNDTIRELHVSTGEVITIAGMAGQIGTTDGVGAAARFDQPWAIVYDGAGSLYVGDWDSGLVRRIWLSTHAVSTIAGQPMQLGVTLGPVQSSAVNEVFALAIDPSGDLLLTSEQAVLRIAPAAP
jgi:hypothetical protein